MIFITPSGPLMWSLPATLQTSRSTGSIFKMRPDASSLAPGSPPGATSPHLWRSSKKVRPSHQRRAHSPAASSLMKCELASKKKTEKPTPAPTPLSTKITKAQKRHRRQCGKVNLLLSLPTQRARGQTRTERRRNCREQGSKNNVCVKV